MELFKQVTTIEQSKKLVGLGFDKDSASSEWYKTPTDKWEMKSCCHIVSLKDVPCWTINRNVILFKEQNWLSKGDAFN